ncbi:c-type cytochrome biogenesis protein CcmI [Craterilacuibacter sinensis]|uniref:C-type cytochrome biogenesis protein CcmI n=1 Tax=Craterilacuibacter sinensis TaxID=2686017 RepID=A0A845BQ48_9NEIS|nr:c-type cytochrome biogenesis protein CcmI [Craterilacuibacter sinensis]MXR37288.1 c-type cytochrome biogenesis protein CcmI [Craterilacuibacter sinensis]
MTAFLLAVLGLSLLIALAFVWPLWCPPKESCTDLRPVQDDDWLMLEQQRANGELNKDQAEALRQDLARRMAEEEKTAPALASAASGRLAPVLLGTALCLTLTLSAATYAYLGRFDMVNGVQPDSPMLADDMVHKLAARLAANPDDKAGWAMLAHSYYVLGDYDAAVDAFARIEPSLDEEPNLLAEYGMALVMAPAGKQPHPPLAILQRAIAHNPDDSALHVFIAQTLMEAKDTARALAHLDKARQLETGDPERLRFIDMMSEAAHEQAAHSNNKARP